MAGYVRMTSLIVMAAIFLCSGTGIYAAAAQDKAAAGGTDNLSGYEIAERSKDRYIADDEATELWMVLINKNGEKRIRRFLRLRKIFPDKHKEVTLKFISPEDIRDTGFLNQERPKEKYDSQFLYLPSLKQIRRVSSENKEQRWVGSDFFFEDINEIKFNDWEYKRLNDEVCDNEDCYVVEWTPKPDTDTVYSRQVYWYKKDGYLPARIDYYGKKNKLWKRFLAMDFRPAPQGFRWAWHTQIEDFEAEHKTEIFRRWIFFDTAIPDDYFTSRGLEKDISAYSQPSNLWQLINSSGEYDDKFNDK